MGENRQRPVIDLDELERQLRAAAGPRDRVSVPSASDDPLAELARIVGQDDPQRTYWNASATAREQREPGVRDVGFGQSGAREPNFDGFVDAAQARASGGDLRYDDGRSGQPHHDPAYDARGYEPQSSAAAEPDWAMRTSLHDDRQAPHLTHDGQVPHPGFVAEAEPLYDDQGQLPPHAGDFEDEPRPVARKRGWLAIGAVLSVAVVGVAGAMVMRSPTGAKLASSLPPLIKADPSPSKVVPENPGGIEVPNQDRQIYAKGTPDDLKGVKLVGGEEQPLDVSQATRKDLPTAPAATTASTTTSPAVDPATMPKPSPGQVPGLGEARRVKTVSVRPDGTIIDASASGAASDAPPARLASLASSVDMPTPLSGGATPSPGSIPSPRPKPLTTATTTASTTPAKPKAPDAIAIAAAAPAVTTPAATTPAAPKPAAPKPVQVATASADDAAAGAGAWAVQLAAPVSDQEARETSSRLEKRFSGELGGLKPAIRKADVNGKTIYRVRVSGLSRDDATALCTKLQASGGQCFVAKN